MFNAARLYRTYSTTLVCLAVILRGGRDVEKIKASKHRPFHWGYDKPFANRLRMDAEWNSDGIRREKSGHESDRPGKLFPTTALDR